MNIELRDVSFAYGGKKVLESVDMTIGQGETVLLAGASGTGKTTLLNLLAGLAKPDSGAISGLPPEGASVVFQENRLLFQLTVRDNVAIVNKSLSVSQVDGLLAEVGLEGEEASYPASLSGGMQRRVAIARAIAYKKPLYLMDEPFKGLDEEMRRRVVAFVLAHTKGATLIVISHDLSEAALLGARVVRLETVNRQSAAVDSQ